MRSLGAVLLDPYISILLQFFQGRVDLLAEGRLIELILNRLVEPLADTVGLRVTCLGLAVVNVLDGSVELVFVMFTGTTEPCAPVSEDSEQRDLLILKERQHAVIEHICCHKGVLSVVELH